MFTYGFYNSMKGDRKYDAVQMSSIFDGIIEDGIFANVGEQFAVIPGTGMQVIVKTGRAWFKHTWNLNDSWMTLTVPAADSLRPRIDSVVLEVNSNTDVRENSIKIISGTPATPAVAPEMVHADGVDQYRLADITVSSGATSIVADNIAIKVGQGETPFVTAPLKSVDISDLFTQWGAQWENKLDEWSDEFYEWFDNLKQQLTDDVVTNLQKQIDERVKIDDKATATDIALGTPGKWIDASSVKDDVFGLTNGLKIGDIVYSSRDLETETNGEFIACDQRELDINEYPELCKVDFIKDRLRPFYSGCSLPDNIDGPEPSMNRGPTTYSGRFFFINGCLHNGYYYTGSFNNSTTKYIRRYLYSPEDTSAQVADEYSFPTKAGYSDFYVYIKDNMAYVLPVDIKENWYKINLDTKEIITYSAEAQTSHNELDVPYGWFTYLDKICILSFTFANGQYGATTTITNVKAQWTIYIYSTDFSTREVKEILINTDGLGNRYLANNIHNCRYYTNKMLNVIDNIIYFPMYTMSYVSSKYTNIGIRLYMLNIESGTSTYTEFNTGISQSIALYSPTSNISSILVIANSPYVYIRISCNDGSGKYFCEYLINKSGNIVKDDTRSMSTNTVESEGNRSVLYDVYMHITSDLEYVFYTYVADDSPQSMDARYPALIQRHIGEDFSKEFIYLDDVNYQNIKPSSWNISPIMLDFEQSAANRFTRYVSPDLLEIINPIHYLSTFLYQPPVQVNSNNYTSLYWHDIYAKELDFKGSNAYGNLEQLYVQHANNSSYITPPTMAEYDTKTKKIKCGFIAAVDITKNYRVFSATYMTNYIRFNNYIINIFNNTTSTAIDALVFYTDLNIRIAPYMPGAYIKAKELPA